MPISMHAEASAATRNGARHYSVRSGALSVTATWQRSRRTTSHHPHWRVSSPRSARSEQTSPAPARRSTGSSCTANTHEQRRSESPPKGARGSRHLRGTVDHMAYSQPMIEAGSTRIGRWLRERRLRLALWVAVVEGLLVALTP